MPPLEQSTTEGDYTPYKPRQFGKRGQSISITNAISHDFHNETGFDQWTDSESESYEPFGNMEACPNEALLLPSLRYFEEEKSTDMDHSYSCRENNYTTTNANRLEKMMEYTITKTCCYPYSNWFLTLDDADDRRSNNRRVTFSPQMEHVMEIPSHRCLDPQVKKDLYSSLRSIHAEAMRNRKEWDYELRNSHRVVEESEFIPDCHGNLWHPAHWSTII